MARAERIEYEGAFYHVMNRGRGRQQIYHGKQYYEYFLRCIEQAHIRFAFEVHAYCLMGNHYHLLVRTPRGNLSRAMRHINGVYTQHYNYLKKTDGTLFRGRYKAINIEASSYLLAVSRYIHRNPIETQRPLVDKLEQYRWSSYPSYRNQTETPEWLYKDAVFGELGSKKPTAAYRRYVESGNDEETEKFYAKNRWPAVRGSDKFTQKAHRFSNGEQTAVSRVRREVDVDVILRSVAGHFSCDQGELLVAKRGQGVDNVARSMAMKLCQEQGGMKLSGIGAIFGLSSVSGVTKTISRLNQRMKDDVELMKRHSSLCREISR